MVRGRLTSVAAAAIAITAIAASASAQITTGTVSGTVKDPQGGVIPGAAVTLTSDTRGTKLSDVFTNEQGDFTFVNVPPDKYTLSVSMQGFKPARQSGISVSPGDRLSIGAFTIEVGGLTDTVTVKAESPLVQSQSGERSFTVPTTAVENLPIGNRSFTELAKLAPGVTTVNGSGDPGRIGGGGDTNIMMDGVGVMDTGSNRPLLQMNVESIAEVKILTSGYQAEYGRSSGMQISAVTKSGTNRFRGSVYDVQRDSDWNSNSKLNKLNGNPKTILKEKDWGYSIGGPIGKPGGTNKLFFFYSQEFSPRTAGNDVQRFRVPTALERAGDFSQTLDQNGTLYNLIKDPLNPSPCTGTNTSGCFADGGVVGRIPADRLYQTGLNILKLYPLPNAGGAGIGYNYEVTRPTQSLLSWQPAVRVDYQPSTKLRVTGKYSGWQQRRDQITGSLPGFNDTQMQRPVISNLAFTANYNLSNSMFLEGTYGRSRNELAGCALAQTGTGPNFCTAAVPMDAGSYRGNVGLGSLPLLFPNANKINPAYYAAQALDGMNPAPPAWVNGDFQKVPAFTWGSRVSPAPPNIPFPTYFNVNATQDVSISLTKVIGRHTMKAGYFNTHSYKAEQATGADSFGTIGFGQDANNVFDTTYGYANAAIGSFASFAQAQNYIEGNFVYDNREAYAQDNWKVNNRLTLDYGMRFVHMTPQYDKLNQGSNFLPDKWTLANAPQLFRPGCSISPIPATGCPTASQQALNPVTGQLLTGNSSVAIGTLVPGTGSPTNGVFLGGDGIATEAYTFPNLTFAPRFGAAYDLLGDQSTILRGGAGIFYDRPFGNSVILMPGNPPSSRLVTARYAQLQSLGTGGLTTQGAPALNTIDYNAKLPTSFQFSSGVQRTLPWATVVDVEWVGQHSYNSVRSSVNINMVDFGAAFLPQNQNPNVAGAVLGSGAVSTDLMRAYRGYGAINMRQFNGWRTFHSLQMSFNRRYRDGFSFGFNDTWVLMDHQNGAARLQHAADGSWSVRDDQAQAWDMLNTFIPNSHILKGNFVWDLPDLHASAAGLKAIGYVLNDWQLSGVWTGSTNGPTSTQNSAAAGRYDVTYSYSSGGGNVNITGSPDYGGRVRIVGDPGNGCSSDIYRQFNAAAFQGPLPNSTGLESGGGYLSGCFQSVLDMAIARNIRMGGGRNLQLRVDMFNAPNQAIVTNRNRTMNLSGPGDPVTITNLPYDSSGNILPTRLKPSNAGFGQATQFQPPRTVQVQLRFSF
jgi:Carboxypeptidase regulatory-like domain